MNAMANNSKRLIHIIVFLFFVFIFGLIPVAGVSTLGMKALGIFIGMLYGWTTLGFVWPSMICILALGFSGYYATPDAIYAAGFGNSIVVLLLIILPFVKFCEDTGLSKKMAYWFLSRKFIAGHPWRFTLLILYASFITSWLIDGVAMLFIMWAMLYGIFNDIGYKKGEAYPAWMCFGVVVGCVMSYACKPWSSVDLLAIGALESASGGILTIDFGPFIIATLPYCVISIFGYFLVMKYIARLDVSKLTKIDDAYMDKMRKNLTLDKQQKIALFSLLLYVVVLLLPNILPDSIPFYGFIAKFNYLIGMCVIVAVLCMVKVDGKPLMNFAESAKGISWEAVWMTIIAIEVGNVLCSDEAGLMVHVNNFMTEYFTSSSVWIFILCFMAVLNLLTQVSHNVTIVVIGVPIAYSICMAQGLNPVVFTVLVSISAACAFATPAAATITALGFANSDWIGMKYGFKAGISAFIVGLIMMYVVGLPMCSIVFGLYV